MKIKELRKEHKWTQKETAAQLGINQQTYNNYENGITQPPIGILIDMAALFNVDLDYLCDNIKKINNYDAASPSDKLIIDKFLKLNEQNKIWISGVIDYLLAKKKLGEDWEI